MDLKLRKNLLSELGGLQAIDVQKKLEDLKADRNPDDMLKFLDDLTAGGLSTHQFNLQVCSLISEMCLEVFPANFKQSHLTKASSIAKELIEVGQAPEPHNKEIIQKGQNILDFLKDKKPKNIK